MATILSSCGSSEKPIGVPSGVAETAAASQRLDRLTALATIVVQRAGEGRAPGLTCTDPQRQPSTTATILQPAEAAGFRANDAFLTPLFSSTGADGHAHSWLPRRATGAVHLEGRSAVVRRRDTETMMLLVEGKPRAPIDLHRVQSDQRLDRAPILDGAGGHVIVVRDHSLFESEYSHKIVAPEDQPPDFPRLIGKALEMIEAADQPLSRALRRLVRWYLPIKAPEVRTHNSFSVRYLPGVVFLSVAYDDLRIAEAIVHEYHHNQLYWLQETECLYTSVWEGAFYSPFRPDARPLDGLLHALRVFTGVANFIAKAEQLEALQPYRLSMVDRRCEVVRQLRFGLAQIPLELLTPLGRDVVQNVEESVAAHEAEFGPLRAPLPPPLERHLAAWKLAHPDLTHAIRVPGGVTLPS